MRTREVSKLNDKEFAEVIKNTPLVSIDLIVKNAKDKVDPLVKTIFYHF